MAIKKQSLFVAAYLLLLSSSFINAQGDAEDVEVPKNEAWLKQVNLASVPDIAVRPVGSGICENVDCDGPENDRCFETCGNTPTPADIYGCPKDHSWALTFDDGPSQYTDKLLDILDEHNIKATFCVMGSHVEKYPHIVKRAYEAGHHIASHTYSHPHLMSLTNEEIIYEMKATEKAIEDAIGIKPKYARPPFGEADGRVKALLKSMGYKVLLWNVDPTDYDVYMRADASKKIRGAFKSAAAGIDTGLNPHEDPGFISLQHDLYNQSIAQVPHIIDYLTHLGYSFLTAAECLDDHEPHELLNGALEAQNAANNTSPIVDASSTSSPTGSPSSDPSSSPSSSPSSTNKNNNTTERNQKQNTHVSGATTTESYSLTRLFVSALGTLALTPFFL
ncbi:hypothetical protein BDA99DRAFT_495796 [Phascolomyces articulosus]|uniref:NodB homology domain-containing protein n=1 Tax=Phascolomyces articulosus TaxID=60185 RepID=A0AAD5K9E7_9FUNG|nr:hypothetical protein BDA99DRAFT_495796 [Phascolomyces articulosus]